MKGKKTKWVGLFGAFSKSASQKGRRDRRLHGDLCWWTTLIKPLEIVRSPKPQVSDFFVFYSKNWLGDLDPEKPESRIQDVSEIKWLTSPDCHMRG